MTQLTKCRCQRPPGKPCNRLATQEDLVCDACRRNGCITMKANWDGSSFLVGAHLEIASWESLVQELEHAPP